MLNCLKAEIYKFTHSPLILLHILTPIICSLVFILYYHFANIDEVQMIFIYEQIIAVSFPMMIAIICFMASKFEKEASNCKMMLIAPYDQFYVHVSKMLVLLFFGLIACLMTFYLFNVGFHLIGYNSYDSIFFVNSSLFLFYMTIPLYVINYVLSMLFHDGFNLTFGLIGSLLSCLLTTGLGNGIWFYLLHGLIARSITNMLVNPLNDIYNISITILAFIIIVLCIAWILLRNFEGSNSTE